MTITAHAQFNPSSGIKALLDQIYDVKFSRHTPLVIVLLSMVYTIYRTQHYLGVAFGLHGLVAWPTAIFIELLVLASSALLFISLRAAYVAELKDEDVERSRWGVWLSLVALVAAFGALLGVASMDAYSLTGAPLPTLIMSFIQIAQALFVIVFVVNADLEEREKLRGQYADYTRAVKQQQANACPHCFKELTPNNRARHIASCPARP